MGKPPTGGRLRSWKKRERERERAMEMARQQKKKTTGGRKKGRKVARRGFWREVVWVLWGHRGRKRIEGGGEGGLEVAGGEEA